MITKKVEELVPGDIIVTDDGELQDVEVVACDTSQVIVRVNDRSCGMRDWWLCRPGTEFDVLPDAPRRWKL